MTSEKVSVNIKDDRLAAIDLLVEEGLVANRSSFINDAIDLLIEKNKSIINKIIRENKNFERPNQWFIGLQSIDKDYLMKYKNSKNKLILKGFGAIFIAKDVDKQLIDDSIESISKKVKIHCSKSQFEALKLKIK